MSDLLYLGTKKGLFAFARSANGWALARTAFLGQDLSAMLPDPRDGCLYVVLHHGHFGPKLQRSRDGGQSWEEIPAPAYPPKPEGLDDRDGAGKPVSWRVEKLWCLEAGHPSTPNVLWAGTLPGGLFRSTDRAQSWQLVESLWNEPKRHAWFGGGADLPGIHSICVHPTEPGTVHLGVSCGGVWSTRDNGATWACTASGMWAAYMPPAGKFDPNIQDPHRVVQCPAQPTHLWAQHHNGVFRSTDDSTSWKEVEGMPVSNFGFAVAVHPRDGNTAWFVPAVKDEVRIPVDGQVVVTRTRDGGKTFDVLRRGLPQQHAYDLTYRHALDVDDTGERLAFGSTTGSAWVSNDQGDTWQCLGEHLPPVHCVRFG